MSNADVEHAWRYHDATRHSYLSVRTSGHFLDWANQPRTFKTYKDALPSVRLPRDLPASDTAALEAIAQVEPAPDRDVVPELAQLAYLLFCTGGITKRKPYPGGEMLFRAASCTGALYEVELYVACADLPDLLAGLYHFDPAEFVLRRLRAGDYRKAVAHATGDEPAVVCAPLVVACTGTYWRNAWKYQARTYRHFGWDNGTMLANALAAAAVLGLPARLVCGFVDGEMNGLLGLDSNREVTFSLLALGRTAAPPPEPPPIEPLALDTLPVSASEVDYPIMRELHEASSLGSATEVGAWRERARACVAEAAARRKPPAPEATVALRPAAAEALRRDPLEEVILRRGSSRRFRRGASIRFEQLSTMLVHATQGIPADFVGSSSGADAAATGSAPRPLLNDLYVIVHAVDDLQPGAYVLHREPHALELLIAGQFRQQAGYLGLEQDLPADAAAVVFFLADLHAILACHGNRGYRMAQLEAGILGGKLYLAAYALRLGASGLTFYDDDVVEFFSPHAAGKSAIFCMTLGRSAKAQSVF